MVKKPIVTTNDKGDRYVLFFGHTEDKPNYVCSNWYMSNFEVGGIKFNCVEQFMMYHKAMLFKDTAVANEILKETSPKEMKKYGRKVRGYVNSVWDAAREAVVHEGVLEKFKQNPELLAWMKSIDCEYFVECSPYDEIWGVKLPITSKRVLNPDTWNGTNLLGKILKRVNAELKDA